MAAAGAPAARCLTVLLTLAVLLGHPGQALGLQGEGAAAVNEAPSYEELATSLVANQLVLLQLMQNASIVASVSRIEEALDSLKAEHLTLKGEINSCKEDMLKLEEAVEAGQQSRLQEILDVLRDEIKNTKQETLAGVASLREDMTSEVASLTSKVTSLQEKTAAQGRLLEKVHKLTTCPGGWLPHESSCYLFDGTGRTWEQSLAYCRGRGGDLAKITSAEEQYFIKSKLRKHTWIGLNDKAKEGHWVWADGSAQPYSAWDRGQPSRSRGENCAVMDNRVSYQWHDYPCNGKYGLVCEQPLHA